MKFFNNNWFTLIELIVSVFISSILLIIIFYFIWINIEEILFSENKTTFYNSLNDFRKDIKSISNTYNSWVILVNNSYWSGSDILLLTSPIKDDWYIIWVVNNETKNLETGSIYYNRYYDKVLWYSRISSWVIADIYLNNSDIYLIPFNRDHLYENLKIKDFQADLYNTWSIIDFDISFLLNYKSNLINQNFIDLSWLDIFRINLNF